jgi:hypothetical protein
MYGAIKEWLKGGAIDDDQELRTDLISRRYAYKLVNGRDAIVLEPKEAMKQRGSPRPTMATRSRSPSPSRSSRTRARASPAPA